MGCGGAFSDSQKCLWPNKTKTAVKLFYVISTAFSHV